MRGSLCSKRVTVGGDWARHMAEIISAVTIHEARGTETINAIVATAKAAVCLQKHTPHVKGSRLCAEVNRHLGIVRDIHKVQSFKRKNMPSTQEMLSFYRDWDRDPFEPRARDASSWKRRPAAPFHQQAPPRRVVRS